VRKSPFKVFSDTVGRGGMVKGITVNGGEGFSRKDLDELTAFVTGLGAKGLAWAKVTATGLSGSIAKFFEGEAGTALAAAMSAKAGDLMVFVADRKEIVHKALGQLRNLLGDKLKLRDPKIFRLAWVMRFPLFEFDEESQRWNSAHHPFTAPVDWDITDFSKDTAAIRSRAYDLVMNGWELGSGSIRIHRPDVQQRVFSFLGIGPEQAQEKFGFLLDAFKYGAPPHGGIALGIDRMVAMALGLDGIRDVIAFPKTASATCLLTRAPNVVDTRQLAELKIASLAPPPKE
jgi:aspartyl-tRNA synthetase